MTEEIIDDDTISGFKLFNKQATTERKEAGQVRKDAVGLLTPKLFREHIKSGQDLVLAYGRKGKEVVYTLDDLQRFANNIDKANKRLKSQFQGVTVKGLQAASLAIDKRRASEVRSATLYRIHKNVLFFRVSGQEQPFYQVRIRLEGWDAAMQSPRLSLLAAAKKAAEGRVSIDCACGRHQYWYRYLSTVGKYALTPPKEQDFPKIRNPRLSGACCKHVLKALTALQTHMVHTVIAREMGRQADNVGFASNVNAHWYTSEMAQKFAKDFLEEEGKKQSVKDKKAKLKPRKTPPIRTSSAIPEDKVKVISDILTLCRQIKASPDYMLDQAVKTLGVTRAQIDAVIKEHNL